MKNFSKNYYEQVSLLIKVLPYLNDLPCFALKGGTAINFFHQNMPRLSVDIDLCYLPLEPRQKSLLEINDALSKMAKRIKQQHPEIQCFLDKSAQTTLPKLQIQVFGAIVKVHAFSEVVENLAIELRQRMTSNEKQFLISLVSGKPNWELMPFTHLKELPALQWKLLNINSMDAEKRKQQVNALEALF